MEGTSSTPEGDGDMSALAESEDDSEMVQDVNLNDQVLEPILKTPSKNPTSLADITKATAHF